LAPHALSGQSPDSSFGDRRQHAGYRMPALKFLYQSYFHVAVKKRAFARIKRQGIGSLRGIQKMRCC
jgi:hypothetical protein